MNWAKKNVLLTGGAGFLGSAIGKRLRNLGANIVVIDDLSSGSKEEIDKFGDDFVRGKVGRETLSKVGSTEYDYVFHFGSPSSVLLYDMIPTALEDTVSGMHEVLKFCREKQVKHLIYPSSSSVYGNSKLPQAEDTPTVPVNIYGVGKLCCEHTARIFSDVNSTGLRIFAGYGPGEMKKVGFWSIVGAFLNDFKSNTGPVIFGDGTQSRDFVYIDDIVDASVKSIEAGYSGIMNVGSGHGYKFIDVLYMISEMLGARLQPKFVPKPKSYFEHTWADISNMQLVTGIKPLKLKEGLAKYLDDLRDPALLALFKI